MLRIALAGTFAARLEQKLRRHLDEAALYRALANRIIAGAPLGPTDPLTEPFHELSNVLMTPHVSGWTDGMLEAPARMIAENISRVGRAEPPLNRSA